mmetsp:Transcript_71270/g.231602  ORF Transcript_71270/g.231602 Transcript_71270/m.231602 type:complete len:206 (+) Transcript_71270:682-1299(+)
MEAADFLGVAAESRGRVGGLQPHIMQQNATISAARGQYMAVPGQRTDAPRVARERPNQMRPLDIPELDLSVVPPDCENVGVVGGIRPAERGARVVPQRAQPLAPLRAQAEGVHDLAAGHREHVVGGVVEATAVEVVLQTRRIQDLVGFLRDLPQLPTRALLGRPELPGRGLLLLQREVGHHVLEEAGAAVRRPQLIVQPRRGRSR